MSYVKDVQAYKAYEERVRRDKEEIRKLKQSVINNADFVCNADEFDALKNYLHFIDERLVLDALVEYYYDLALEKTADQI